MKNDDFVTYEQAQILKELGFDWQCNHYYVQEAQRLIENYKFFDVDYDNIVTCYENNNNYELYISAPTLAQAQKWIREKHNIDIFVTRSFALNTPCYKYEILMNSDYDELISMPTNSYEHALSSAINKVLELLKEQYNENRTN